MIYNVKDFGAVGDGVTLDTKSIQNAIDECFKNGGGEVQIPAGQFVIGDIRIRSNVTLHLLKDAVLLGSLDVNDYFNINNDSIEPLPEDQNTPDLRWYNESIWHREGNTSFKHHLYNVGGRWNYGIIRAAYAENIAIIGEEGSKIDGRDLFDPLGEEDYRGPHAINMHFCKNITLKGYEIINSANWAHAITRSENISFINLQIRDGHDAIHVRNCRNVLIENCTTITGDDCIAGFGNLDVTVRNCKISSLCSAFRFCGKNVLVEDCSIFLHDKAGNGERHNRTSMLSFFTNFSSDDFPPLEAPGNIVIRNCKISGPDKLLHLNLSGNETWQRGNPPTDILFENITIDNIANGFCAYGVQGAPLSITFKNVDYTYREGFENTPFMLAAHLTDLKFENVKVSGYNGNAFIKAWSDITADVNDLDCPIKDGEFIVKADEEFSCDAI